MRNTAVRDTVKSDTAIELTNIVKYFEQLRPVSLLKKEKVKIFALDDVSLKLEKGEFCAYAGPNGAGKSTTFKLLSGMLKPQSGDVKVLGVDPSKSRIPVMERTGILFGNRSELWWDHPVKASFEWKRVVWNISKDEYDKNVDMLKSLLDLDDIWSEFARELSLGQRMRANLALMLLHSPELVLLDEPTLGLDVLAKRQMIDFLKYINRENHVTILVTSHDMDDLTDMAKRIVLINKGKLAFDGDYHKLMEETGDKRMLKLTVTGDAPVIPNTKLVAKSDGVYTYEYDLRHMPTEKLFNEISSISGVVDTELSRAPIESVIAELYVKWQGKK